MFLATQCSGFPNEIHTVFILLYSLNSSMARPLPNLHMMTIFRYSPSYYFLKSILHLYCPGPRPATFSLFGCVPQHLQDSSLSLSVLCASQPWCLSSFPCMATIHLLAPSSALCPGILKSCLWLPFQALAVSLFIYQSEPTGSGTLQTGFWGT